MLPLRRNSADDFQTPPEALKPLLKYLPKEKVIWECACGKGNLVKALRKAGHRVRDTDIKTGTNFLSYQPEPEGCEDLFGPSKKPLGDIIVTNPPYSKKDLFLAVAYMLDLPFAFLMPLTALEGQSRQFYYRTYGIELIILPECLHFETPEGNASHCWFPMAWFCRKLIGRPLVFPSGL